MYLEIKSAILCRYLSVTVLFVSACRCNAAERLAYSVRFSYDLSTHFHAFSHCATKYVQIIFNVIYLTCCFSKEFLETKDFAQKHGEPHFICYPTIAHAYAQWTRNSSVSIFSFDDLKMMMMMMMNTPDVIDIHHLQRLRIPSDNNQ